MMSAILRILVQLVADAAHRKHVMRILRIGFELLPQPIDMRINVALIAFILGAPDGIEEIIARPGTPRLRREQIKNLKLERCQIDSRATARDFMPPSIDNQITNLQTILVTILLSARTPTQQRFDAIFKLARAKWFCQIVI